MTHMHIKVWKHCPKEHLRKNIDMQKRKPPRVTQLKEVDNAFR